MGTNKGLQIDRNFLGMIFNRIRRRISVLHINLLLTI